MSTTVYGCVETDGSITFANLEACLVQSACVEVSGEHAGQVALMLSEADYNEDCNDTFYGCVNPTTGKFQVIIPEGCCQTGLCPCSDYPVWSSNATYLTGQRVISAGYCYISLQDANTGNTPATSPEWWDAIYCDCPAGYVEGTLDCGLAGDVSPPKYLCARIQGVKRCSDDSTIATAYICLEYIENLGGMCFCWEGRGTFDGVTVTVLYRTGSMCMADEDAIVYNASNIWFGASSPDSCSGVGNDIEQEWCGGDMEFCAECSWQCLDPLVKITRTIVGYDGNLTICDPNTGEWWSY